MRPSSISSTRVRDDELTVIEDDDRTGDLEIVVDEVVPAESARLALRAPVTAASHGNSTRSSSPLLDPPLSVTVWRTLADAWGTETYSVTAL
jgi:hypothetical protein